MRLFTVTLISLFILQATEAKDKKPRITGQKDLTTTQGHSIIIHLTDLTVEEGGHGHGGDDHNGSKYPEGYELEIFDGSNYTVAGNTVTPDQAFTGILTVGVLVRKGRDASKKFDLKVTVKPAVPENRPPVITGQSALSTPENTPIEIRFADLIVSDPDDVYPTNFSLQLFAGDHYSLSGKTVTPDPEFTGTLNVKTVVSDGHSDSAPFNLSIEVTEVNSNATPKITGQVPLSTSMNHPLTILLAHLIVVDPDNQYPQDFSLRILPGDHYSVSQSNIVPEENFQGTLGVKIIVSDGTVDSDVFNLKIEVIPDANAAPVITGQVGLNVRAGESLEIKLSYLVVADDDNQFPTDFTLEISAGDHYTFSGHLITPVPGFIGILKVKVTVNDGIATSKPFEMNIQVVPLDKVAIVGQKPLEMREDSTFLLKLSDLIVSDPYGSYPDGYHIQIENGDHYDLGKGSIVPERNFNGNLTATVAVSNGNLSSSPFSLLIIVRPVNDPPELSKLSTDPLMASGQGPWEIAAGAEVTDADDNDLLYAEMGFKDQQYEPGVDKLSFTTTENIHGVFDPERGILDFLGNASLAEYQEIIRSVNYEKDRSDTTKASEKTIYIKLNDGKDASTMYERQVIFEPEAPFEIPGAFTPNNDNANDTWKILSRRQTEDASPLIRVYSRKGILVFEANGLDREWDGQYEGNPLPADVYFYTIEMDSSGTKVNYKGIVAILR